MKTLLFSFFLLAFLLLGCNEAPVQPEESEDPVIQSEEEYELIQIPARAGGGAGFAVTETIDGSKGGQINIHEHYITVDGDTVKVDVKLKIKKDCFSGNVDITMTVDDVYTAVLFSPEMVFDKPLELDFKYKGLDPDKLNLTSGNYDFLYIDDNGNTETILSDGVVVKEQNGEISVKNAMLGHFSRYAFIR